MEIYHGMVWRICVYYGTCKPYMELLTDECDALRFRELTYRGVTYGKENGKLSDKYTLFCFEWMYTLALNAGEEHREMLCIS